MTDARTSERDTFDRDLQALFSWSDEVPSELSEEEANRLTQTVLASARAERASELAAFKRTMLLVAVIVVGGLVGMAMVTPWMFVVVVLAGGFAGWRVRLEHTAPPLPWETAAAGGAEGPGASAPGPR